MMSAQLERIKVELDGLVKMGDRIALAVLWRYSPKSLNGRLSEESQKVLEAVNIETQYQSWYSEALSVVRQILPAREADFRSFYEYPGRKTELSMTNFRIADALRGVSMQREMDFEMKEVVGWSTCYPLLNAQVAIVKAARSRFDSALYDIRQVVQADLFDSEVDAAKELNRRGFSRAAGAMAGVVLEKHFKTVLSAHGLTLAKKNPCINDYNQKLKDESIIDVPTWRFIQRLGDLRNLCDHDKGSEPLRELIAELIDGVDRIMKTVA